MPDPALLRIGPFSRASSLSVKALRGYHEAGLLVPAEVDPRTGYRSYAVDQLADAAVIRQLRQIDLPLEAIGQVLDARDPDVTRKILDEHGAALETRLEATRRAIDDLTRGSIADLGDGPVIRHEAARTVLSISGTCPEDELGTFLAEAVGLLLDASVDSGAVVDGPIGATFPTLLDDEHQEVTAYVPVTTAPLVSARHRRAGIVVDELPAADVATVVHHGSYEGLTEAYRSLGAWVAAHAEPAELPVRERYLVTLMDVGELDELRTEISWPILAGSSTDRTDRPEEHP